MQIRETKCTCAACGNVWYYGKTEVADKYMADAQDQLKSALCCTGCGPALLIPDKKVVDYEKCPKCSSRAIKREDVTHDV